MDLNLIKRILDLGKRNDLTDDDQIIVARFLVGENNAPDESIVKQDADNVNEHKDGTMTEKQDPDDLVLYTVLAQETGYSRSGVRSAIDRPENGIQVYCKGKKRYVSRAAWAKYCETTGTGPQLHKPRGPNKPMNPNRLVKNWYPGGSSKQISNHEIRGWMTIPQCATHTAVQEITIRNLIKKGLLTTVIIEKKDGAADIIGVHADEVFALVKGGPRSIPDVTVFDRWDKVTLVADYLTLDQSGLSKSAANAEIASHRIGRYLYVHVGEIEKALT